MAAGKFKLIEDHLRSTFRKAIGATTVGEASEPSQGITFNKAKGVFQACVKLSDQSFVKEFKLKEDAQHWVDLLTSLDNKKLLKGHFSTMKEAAATRKATQEAYEKIMSSKQVFTPESSKAWQRTSSEGKDVWNSMFSKYAAKEATLPGAFVRLPQNSMDKLKELGFDHEIFGELFGWKHKSLGWRATNILTHTGDAEDIFSNETQAGMNLSHLGFIRCKPVDQPPDLLEDDKAKIVRHLEHQPKILVIIVTYPIKVGTARAWEAQTSSTGLKLDEVEVEYISRRVQGEQFLVTALQPNAKIPLGDLMTRCFEKHLLENSGSEPSPLSSFKRIPVLGDGLCFWHCILRSTLPRTYNVPRTPSGAPRSSEHLAKEIDLAKATRQEFLNMCLEKPGSVPEEVVEEVSDSEQVSFQAAHHICEMAGVCLRISMDMQARVTGFPCRGGVHGI